MDEVVCPSSESSLLINTASKDSSSPLQHKISCPRSKHICLPSKAAIFILLWTVIVGTIYHNLVGLSAALVVSDSHRNAIFSAYESLPYAILAVVMMFYPLSGFIADVCCGRLKMVVVGTLLLLSCWILLLLGICVTFTIPNYTIMQVQDQGFVVVILCFLSLLTFIIGLAGYQANFIQLGLDQLFEAPSQYLGLFIHYAVWAFALGSVTFLTNFLMSLCSIVNQSMKISLCALQVILPLILIVMLVISYRKRRWFRNEPGHQNPYKNVYGIFNFAKSHKHPLRRSAFTYSDDCLPSRLDFAKERFGGPFTTEQVENVKSFLRVLLILFAVGPVFSLEVPASYFIFPLFGMHFLYNYPTLQEFCTHEFIWNAFLESGGLIIVSVVIFFPIYIWLVFSLPRTKVPNQFVRLGIGIVLSLLGVTSLLITDVSGHAVNNSDFGNHSMCVFQVAVSHNFSLLHPSLDMHWAVLIPPSVFLGIGPLLVIATTLEFISAQSPQSMKGLLVGVFFAIRGLFQFLNSVIIIPLSLKQPWASGEMIEHPPVTNCGFVYLMVTCITGLIGLILFSLAAKRYKYRTRDEGMFCQHDVEEIYDRYMDLDQAVTDS